MLYLGVVCTLLIYFTAYWMVKDTGKLKIDAKTRGVFARDNYEGLAKYEPPNLQTIWPG